MEKSLTFNSSVCTTRKQSQRLLELGLKPETADMYITNMSNKGVNYTDDYQIGSISFERVMSFWKEKGLKLENTAWEIIPSWSLHRLIEMCNKIQFGMTIGIYNNEVTIDGDLFEVFDNTYDNLISVIEWLIKGGHFNKEYLKQ